MPANIILTYRCPNRCAYCFADGTRSRPSAQLTAEEFDYYLAFLKRSKNERPQLIGGEPFLHPLAPQFIRTVLEEECFRKLCILTSGFVHPKYDSLLKSSRVCLLVNVNSPDDYPPGVFGKLTRRLEELVALPVRLTIGFNIYREDFDYVPVLQLAHRLGSEFLRWSLASPCADGPTQHLDRAGRRRVIPRLIRFLEDCNRARLQPRMDCPIEPCLLTDEQLGRVCRLLPGRKLWPYDCGIPLDLGPGYRAYRCLAVGEAFTVDARGFADEDALREHFRRTCDCQRREAAPAECRKCSYFVSGDCGGGCLGLMHSRLIKPSLASASPLRSFSASLADVCRRAEELHDQDCGQFVRHMAEHAAVLHGVNTLAMHLLWADYYRLLNEPASVERHLVLAIPHAGDCAAAGIRQLLAHVRAGERLDACSATAQAN